MKTEDIRAFVAVVRHKSISRAAEAMQVNQSIVTRRVQSLEETLGVELLNRKTKPPVPTEVGLKVFEEAQLIVQQLEHLNGIALAVSESAPRLRIGMPQFLGEALAFRMVQFLKEAHPRLAIQITTALSPTLMDSIDLGELDVAIVARPQHAMLPEHLTGKKIGDFQIGVVARAEDAPAGACSLHELHRHSWILNPPGCGFRAFLERSLAEQGLPLTVKLDVFGTELQFELVASGLGLGLVPAFMLPASQHAPKLRLVNVTDFSPRNDIWLLQARAATPFGAVIGDLSGFVSHTLPLP